MALFCSVILLSVYTSNAGAVLGIQVTYVDALAWNDAAEVVGAIQASAWPNSYVM
jgi:hypothetical protein